MNRNELEQWMKESLDRADFTPDEAGWNKLQAAVRPAPEKKHKSRGILFPVLFKSAAAIALLATAGMGIFYVQHLQHRPFIAMTGSNPSLPLKLQQAEIIPLSPSPALAGHTKNSSLTAVRTAAPVSAYLPPNSPATDSLHTAGIISSVPEAAGLNTPGTMKPEIPVTRNPDRHAGIAGFLPEPERTAQHPLNFGVAAQLGRASVGNMQYQFGVVARQRLSGKFYAAATLAIAATEVSQLQQNSFRSVSLGSGGIGSTVTEKRVEAQYGKSIVSMGFSPSVGYNVVRHISVAVGATLYRNLDQSLSLKNQETIDPVVLNNKVITDTKEVSAWDAGLTGSANCNVSKKLSVTVQYRYGLSDYMYFNDQPVRNSGLNIGVQYLFGAH